MPDPDDLNSVGKAFKELSKNIQHPCFSLNKPEHLASSFNNPEQKGELTVKVCVVFLLLNFFVRLFLVKNNLFYNFYSHT